MLAGRLSTGVAMGRTFALAAAAGRFDTGVSEMLAGRLNTGVAIGRTFALATAAGRFDTPMAECVNVDFLRGLDEMPTQMY